MTKNDEKVDFFLTQQSQDLEDVDQALKNYNPFSNDGETVIHSPTNDLEECHSPMVIQKFNFGEE